MTGAAGEHPSELTGKRRGARLAAVQALYQVELTGAAAAAVVEEWRRYRIAEGAAGDDAEGHAGRVDSELFSDLVQGALRRRSDIDGMIRPALAKGWTLERLEMVLRAILRAGVYELLARVEVPAKVVIVEYVDIAHGFFAGREPAFVNAVLDAIARRVRPHEFDAEPESAVGGADAHATG